MPDFQSSTILETRVGLIEPLTEDRHSGTWHAIRFQPAFTEGRHVIVLFGTQSYEEPETPGLRIRNVTQTGFEIRFDEIVRNDGARACRHLRMLRLTVHRTELLCWNREIESKDGRQ